MNNQKMQDIPNLIKSLSTSEFRTFTKKLDREQLKLVKVEIEMLIDSLDLQISGAKARAYQGEYSDPKWFQSVQSLRMRVGRYVQMIQQELGRRTEQQKKERTMSFERMFMDCAYELLDTETYAKINDLAHERTVVSGENHEK